MRKIFNIILAFSILLFSHAGFGWNFVTKHSGHTLYMDLDRIRTNGNDVFFWILFDDAKPSDSGSMSSIHYVQARCKQQQWRWLQDHFYKKPMAQGKPSSSINKPTEWEYSTPNSFLDTAVTLACTLKK
jgi:hypothetical protein